MRRKKNKDNVQRTLPDKHTCVVFWVLCMFAAPVLEPSARGARKSYIISHESFLVFTREHVTLNNVFFFALCSRVFWYTLCHIVSV